MPTQPSQSPTATLIQRLVHAYARWRSCGIRIVSSIDLAATRSSRKATPAHSFSVSDPTEALAISITRPQRPPAANTEPLHQQLEDQVLNLAVQLHAAGMLKIQNIAHPSLATMVSDDLTETVSWRPRSRQP